MSMPSVTPQRCRTCTDTTANNFHPLTDVLIAESHQQKSLAQFLWEISRMDNVSKHAKFLPQQICGNCSRKLRIVYSFVRQVQKVNESLLANLDIGNETELAEPPIDMPEEAEKIKIEIELNEYCAERRDEFSSNQECLSNCNNPCVKNCEAKINDSAIINQDPLAFVQTSSDRVMAGDGIDSDIYNESQNILDETSGDSSSPVLEANEKKRSFNSSLEPGRSAPSKRKKFSLSDVPCPNKCHIEIKFMLRELMSIQKKLIERVKSVERYVIGKLPARIDMIAQKKMLKKCKAMTAKVPQSANLIIGEVDTKEVVEVQTWFPISSNEEALEIDQKLKDENYAAAIIAHLKKVKGFNGVVNDVLRKLFTDELIAQYNFDGRAGKKAINGLKLVTECVYNVFSDNTVDEFYKLVRRYIELSHNRSKQRKFDRKKKYDCEAKANNTSVSSKDPLCSQQLMDEIIPAESTLVVLKDVVKEKSFDTPFESGASACPKGKKMSCSETVCQNQCHIEMKFMLRELMSIQKKLIERVKSVERYVIRRLPERTDMITQKKMLRVCKAMTGKVQQSVNRILGEVDRKELAEVQTWFPISSNERALEIDQKLKDEGYAEAVMAHLKKIKGFNGVVDDVLRTLFTDELIEQYNFDGRAGKKALSGLKLVTECVYNVFSDTTTVDFFKLVRRYIELSHNRSKQRKFDRKKKGDALLN